MRWKVLRLLREALSDHQLTNLRITSAAVHHHESHTLPRVPVTRDKCWLMHTSTSVVLDTSSVVLSSTTVLLYYCATFFIYWKTGRKCTGG
jgi:hypothetical protein